MKKTFLFTILLIVSITITGYAQSDGWKILTIARELSSINMISSTKGYVYGGDIAYKTTDAGLSWSYPQIMNPTVGFSFYYTNSEPADVIFIDSLKGWSPYINNQLVKTVNGTSWNVVNTNINYVYLNCIFFINSMTGWAGGRIGQFPQSLILKTTNNGLNWIRQSTGIDYVVRCIVMINSTKGFYTAQNTDTIGYTTDGGNSWLKKKIGNGQPVNKIIFIDSLRGWALGHNNFITKTTDGGSNWSLITTPIGNTQNIYFFDSATGWISETTQSQRLWKTTNGGLNWFANMSFQPNRVLDIFFRNSTTGWVSTTNGYLWITTNGGTNWNSLVDPPYGYIHSLDFTDVNNGWMLSSYRNIWKTTNRGYNWTNTRSENNLNSIDFTNAQTGYVCGDFGKILKTTNSGINWININSGNVNYKSICFVNDNTGWSCGSEGKIIKTTNAGLNWVHQNSNSIFGLNDIHFTDVQNGFIAGDSGYVLKTTNGGTQWDTITPGNKFAYNKINFVNTNTGYAIGHRRYLSNDVWFYIRVMQKTTNSGQSWSEIINISSPIFQVFFEDVFFINGNTGWYLEKNGISGTILKTTNGGLNWVQAYHRQKDAIACLFSLGESYTWAGGDGIVLTTSTPIGINQIGSKVPSNFLLNQNYPNPFNPQTKIKFDVPRASFTKIIIYDLLGREVATLVNEELRPGTYEADWDASSFSSGVYFSVLQTDNFYQANKMILVK